MFSIQEFFTKIEPFSRLSTDSLQSLSDKTDAKQLTKGEFVFQQGEESTGFLYLIARGLAEIVLTDKRGQARIIGYRRQGDLFGETVIFSNKTYPAALRAATDLILVLIPGEVFEQMLLAEPELEIFFSRLLTNRFREIFQEFSENEVQVPFATLESSAALKRASEIMSHPLISCNPDTDVSSVARLMLENHVSSLVVTQSDNSLCGLITEHDLIAKVLVIGCQSSLKAGDIMDTRPQQIQSSASYYQILLKMIQQTTKHVVVCQQQTPIGIITIRDLMRLRNTGLITVLDRIEDQSSAAGLSHVGPEVDNVLRGLLAEKAPLSIIFDIITAYYDRLTCRLIELALEEMRSEGYGWPPAPFCWLTMGSSGRREQYLRTDQDNALVYECSAETIDQVEPFFSQLAQRVVSRLETCGFALCKGKVMATYPQWRGNLTSWERRLSSWLHVPKTENIRLLTIFLDFRPLYGDQTLAQQLRSHIRQHLGSQAYHYLAEDATQFHVPLGLFGQIIGKKSNDHKREINLKAGTSVHLVDCVRLFAFKENLEATSTFDRVRELGQRTTISPDFAEQLATAYQTVMLFRIKENLHKVDLSLNPDNHLDVDTLNSREYKVLRESLRVIDRLQSLTRQTFLAH